MPATSHSLLHRLKDGADPTAWQRLLAIYEPWLRGWLSRHELQAADIEDLLQEFLLVVNEKLREFQHTGQPGAFRAWLRSILTHRVRHFLRGRRVRQALAAEAPPIWLDQLEDPGSDLTRQWNEEHDQQLVRRLLALIQGDFQPQTWQVFQMLVLEDRPAAEVAERFGLTPNSVYVAKARVLSRLRSELTGLVDL